MAQRRVRAAAKRDRAKQGAYGWARSQAVGRSRTKCETDGTDAYDHADARYVGWDGGTPVFYDGNYLVAISGWSGEEDVEIACIGVDAIFSSLPR